MRDNLKKVYILMTVLSLALSATRLTAQTSMCPEPPENSVSYTLSLPSAQLHVGEQINVDLVIKNVSTKTLSFWVENAGDQGGRVYTFRVLDQRGNKVPDGDFTLALRGQHDPTYKSAETPMTGSGGCVDLGPGQSRHERININRLHKLAAAGSYSIVLTKELPGGEQIPISNKMLLQLLP
jgi:hypothetical protein